MTRNELYRALSDEFTDLGANGTCTGTQAKNRIARALNRLFPEPEPPPPTGGIALEPGTAIDETETPEPPATDPTPATPAGEEPGTSINEPPRAGEQSAPAGDEQPITEPQQARAA